MKKTVLLIIGFLFLVIPLFAQTILSAGDIILVTVNTDGDKNFDFVPLVDLEIGTTVNFTDNAWVSVNSALNTNEGIITYTASSFVYQGSIVSYSGSNGNGFIETDLGFNPSTSGDNIIVYQGSESSPSFLYGIGWAKASSWSYTNTNDSDIPTGLSVGSNTILNLGTYDNYQYNGSTIFTSPSAFLIATGDESNWEGRNDPVYSVFGTDIILPVNLSSFYAVYVGGTPTLYWTTQTEENNDYWNVYRGTSENYETAAQINAEPVPGNGTTNYASDYIYVDTAPVVQNSTYWYWIEDVSTDGEIVVHEPITLDVPFEDTPNTYDIYGLHQNYPNPFNPSTSISFNLDEDSNVELIIYNVKGEKIKSIFSDQVYADQINSVVWDGNDANGKQVSSGVYFYKLITDTKEYQRKMLLVK